MSSHKRRKEVQYEFVLCLANNGKSQFSSSRSIQNAGLYTADVLEEM